MAFLDLFQKKQGEALFYEALFYYGTLGLTLFYLKTLGVLLQSSNILYTTKQNVIVYSLTIFKVFFPTGNEKSHVTLLTNIILFLIWVDVRFPQN